ncbi:MAG: internal scaffolding protein [Arizlama microvirus]|nr:MAG: internal scaffolding protein [Arizlama microvirus]
MSGNKEKLIGFRSNYDYGYRSQVTFSEPSRTKQSFKDESDINNILKKYRQTGVFPLASQQGQYGDFSQVTDYQSALNQVAIARSAFTSLPSHIRERFLNDPARFISFAEDPKNSREMIELGLATRLNIEQPREPEGNLKEPKASKSAKSEKSNPDE